MCCPNIYRPAKCFKFIEECGVELFERSAKASACAGRHDRCIGVNAFNNVVGALGQISHLGWRSRVESAQVCFIPWLINLDLSLVASCYRTNPVIPVGHVCWDTGCIGYWQRNGVTLIGCPRGSSGQHHEDVTHTVLVRNSHRVIKSRPIEDPTAGLNVGPRSAIVPEANRPEFNVGPHSILRVFYVQSKQGVIDYGPFKVVGRVTNWCRLCWCCQWNDQGPSNEGSEQISSS